MVDRFTVYPGVTYHTGQPHQNIKGEYVRYSDYEALQKELAERTAERDEARAEIEHWQKGATCGCRYDSPDDVCDLHSPAVAAEKSRADTLARRVEGLEAALRHDQWAIVSRAVERFISGEISDLHAIGLVAAGFLHLEEARDAALKQKDGGNG